MKQALLSIFGATCLTIGTMAQCGPSGTGVDGAYSATSNTTLAGGTYNYTTFNIDSGVTVTVTGNQPLVINCISSATIYGVLTADGANGTDGVTSNTNGLGGIGVAGGGNGGDGVYSVNSGPLPGIAGAGPGAVSNQGDAWSGGGGAGHAIEGDSSGNGGGGFGGPAYGIPQISAMEAGSGGGGGSGGYSCGGGGGGAGGGYIAVFAQHIIVGPGALITADGGNGGSDGTGNCGGGGGGSGGTIWLAAPVMVHYGLLSAMGGAGGASNVPGSPYYGTGANGAEGRIRFDFNANPTGTGTFNPSLGYYEDLNVVQNFLGPDLVICANETHQMCGLSGFSYIWSNASTTMCTSTTTAGCFSLYMTDSVGCVSVDTVCITVDPCLGILTPKTEAFSLFPNPANTVVTITHGMNEAQLVNVVDVTGKVCIAELVYSNGQINIGSLAEGIYTVRIGDRIEKLVITR